MTWMRRGDCPAVFSLISCGETHARERNPRRARQDGGHGRFSNNRTLFFVPTTSPRRKMAFSSRYSKASHGEYLRTRTPQGDGNKKFAADIEYILLHLRTRTPQGDGNLSKRLFSKSLFEFKNQNPARGRKQLHKGSFGTFSRAFKNQNPARGRKLSYGYEGFHLYQYLRTRTPQGDGNDYSQCTIFTRYERFKNQNPARGRKLASAALLIIGLIDLRTRTPQGDGNFVLPCLFKPSLVINLRTRTPQGDGNKKRL